MPQRSQVIAATTSGIEAVDVLLWLLYNAVRWCCEPDRVKRTRRRTGTCSAFDVDWQVQPTVTGSAQPNSSHVDLNSGQMYAPARGRTLLVRLVHT